MTDTFSNIIQRHGCLCPNCGASTLRISTDAVVTYDITYDTQASELVVVGERIGDSEWDLKSEADCPQCHWHGRLENCL